MRERDCKVKNLFNINDTVRIIGISGSYRIVGILLESLNSNCKAICYELMDEKSGKTITEKERDLVQI